MVVPQAMKQLPSKRSCFFSEQCCILTEEKSGRTVSLLILCDILLQEGAAVIVFSDGMWCPKGKASKTNQRTPPTPLW